MHSLEIIKKMNAPGYKHSVELKTSTISLDENGMSSERSIACALLDVIEDFLHDKGIEVQNDEKCGYGDDTAILFGSDWYSLEDEFTEILKKENKDE